MAQEGFEQVELVVRTIAQTAVDNEKYFGDLDAVVGDGDFGYSLARGFEIVLADWDDLDRTDVGTFLRKVAVIITSRIGGTSGPIWGTAFLRAAGAVSGAEAIGGDERRGDAAGGHRGHQGSAASADVGDKTLLDALVPATDALEEGLRAGDGAAAAAATAATTAREAAEATTSMLAKRGRASYTGERSIGSPDAGAIGVAVMFERNRQGLARDLALAGHISSQPCEERRRHEEVRQRPQDIRARDAQGHRPGQPGHAQATCPSTT